MWICSPPDFPITGGTIKNAALGAAYFAAEAPRATIAKSRWTTCWPRWPTNTGSSASPPRRSPRRRSNRSTDQSFLTRTGDPARPEFETHPGRTSGSDCRHA